MRRRKRASGASFSGRRGRADMTAESVNADPGEYHKSNHDHYSHDHNSREPVRLIRRREHELLDEQPSILESNLNTGASGVRQKSMALTLTGNGGFLSPVRSLDGVVNTAGSWRCEPVFNESV